ncbi:T9SS type A sorting domain-containing protein [Formosa sp. A9]|uniref:T9SS type A sorting domain-containing protein n=1 Tax=Formosa sp. A9 TaxID=3442641 RepID=UPI003EBA9283
MRAPKTSTNYICNSHIFFKLFLILFLLFSFNGYAQEALAFPNAKGAGAYTTGGRGGKVIHVTTLNWDGPGSLKEALRTQGPRTIVFDVSGEIDATSQGAYSTIISGAAYNDVTIAGQTAPEGGITIRTSEFMFTNVSNIIIRYIRFRGDKGSAQDAFWLGGGSNIIIDHCTFSHGGDESASLASSSGSMGDITMQNCFFQDSKTGSILGVDDVKGNFTFINNLYSGISHRFPNPKGEGHYDIINNAVYNWKNRLIRITGGGTYNVINNYYKPSKRGLRSSAWFGSGKISFLQKLQTRATDNPLIYTAGNIVTGQRETPLLDDSDMWHVFAGSHLSEGMLVPKSYFTSSQFKLVGKAYDIESANQAFNNIINNVGANKYLQANGTFTVYLDSKDESDLQMVKNDTYSGSFFDDRSTIPYPTVPNNTRPSNYDTDQDGMADEWERNTFGDLSRDGKGDHDGDGYTDLEEFLNGVDGGNTTTPEEDLEVNAGQDQTICEGEQVTLKASGADSYEWNTGETTQSITVSPSKTTTYTVTGTSDSGKTNTDQVTVTVVETPIVNAGDDVEICEDSSVELTASGSGDFKWSTGETTKTITVKPDKTTTYTVTASNGTCSSSDEVKVTVTPRQTINAGSDVTIELGESTTLSVSGTGSIRWSTGETTREITVSPDKTTVYTVTVSQNGCESQDQVRVTVEATKIEVEADAGEDQTICSGESVTLTASGGSSYEWSTGETTRSITVSPSETTTYSVVVSEEGESDTAEVTVTVNALPNANAGADQTITQGESVTLTASGGSSYEWNTGETTRSITVSPNATRNYTVEVFNSAGCSDTDQVRVTVEATKIEVEADAGEDQTICVGESVTLTASGGSSYEWSTGETTRSITVSPSETTTYSVVVSEEGERDTAEVTVTVNALPNANAGADQTITQGESVTLTASGGSSYEWNTGETTRSITVSPNATRNYTVEVFNSAGCSDTDQVRVTVEATKIEVEADAGEDQTICVGESVTLTASGGSSYEWSTGETTRSITVSPSETTTYSVVVSEEGERDTAEVTVTVNALPNANAGADQTITQGESVTLTASGGSSYEWNTGETTRSITVSPNATRNYTVEVFNSAGCSDTDQVRVTVEATKIEVEADAGEDQTICAGESVTLTASGGSSYEWSTGEMTRSITVSPSETTTYSVVVSEEGESDTAEVTVTVNALPNANAGADQTITQGESVTLTASGGSSYEWNTGETTRSITVSPNATRNYTVEVFNSAGCSDTDQVRVTVEATKIEVEADAGEDQTICVGESVTLTASGGSSYEWSTGETTRSITVSPSETTTYSVVVSEEGESDTAEVTVTVNALPNANAGADQTITQGESVTLTASGGSSYEWNTGDDTSSIVVTPEDTTVYSVIVYNASGCYDIAEVTVTVEAFKGGGDEGDEGDIEEGIVTPNFEFNMYPNPTSGILNLKIAGLESGTPVRVYDMLGKLLIDDYIPASDGNEINKVLDLSRYPKGFYLLTLQVKGKTITKKVVLNN